MLEVSLVAKLGTFALDVAFETGRGVTGLFGRSGAGKSSIVNMIAGLRRPDRGRIALGGRVLLDTTAGVELAPRSRQVGLVLQDALLFPHLSVRQNLMFGAGRGERVPDTASVAGLLGLQHLMDRMPGSLSGGEAQRVAIGRALMSAPRILLMDEPLSQLDGARRAEILPWLDRLAHESGTPILFVSHALDEMVRLADNLVVLSEGAVLASGPITDVLGRIDLGPATGRYEAGSVLEGVIVEHDAIYAISQLSIGTQTVLVPRVDAPPGTPVRLRVRARDVALAIDPPSRTSVRNALRGSILAVAPEEGAFAEILVSVGDQKLRSRITRHAVEDLAIAPGQPVYCLVKGIAVDIVIAREPAFEAAN